MQNSTGIYQPLHFSYSSLRLIASVYYWENGCVVQNGRLKDNTMLQEAKYILLAAIWE